MKSRPAGFDALPALNLWIAGVVTLGVTLRFWHYLVQRSLWIDEARLALNVGYRSYGALLRPLDYDQAAPPLFLWATKFLVGLFGMNELVLRLIPVLAGIAALLLLVPIARRFLSGWEWLVALAVIAVFPVFVYYSNEFKPYSLDAAAGAGLSLLALRFAERPSARRTLALGIAGVLAPWASTGAVFVLVGIGAVLLNRRDPRAAGVSWAMPLILLGWAASLAATYFAFYRESSANPYLHQFWEYRMLSPIQPEWARRVWVALNEILTGSLSWTSRDRELSVVSIGLTGLFLLLLAIGSLRFFRAGGVVRVGIALAPFLAVLTAATFGVYPLARRLLLFSTPFIVMLVVAGMSEVLRRTRWTLRPLVLALFAAALVHQPYLAFIAAVAPEELQFAGSVIDEFNRRALPGETIYVEAGALPMWTLYTTDWHAPDTARLSFAARSGSSGGSAFENAAPRSEAVGREGDSLVYRAGERKELYGVFTGMQWRWGRGLNQETPDPGWSANEVRRIMALPENKLWLIFLYDLGSSQALRSALDLAGAKETYVFQRGFMQLVRIEK